MSLIPKILATKLVSFSKNVYSRTPSELLHGLFKFPNNRYIFKVILIPILELSMNRSFLNYSMKFHRELQNWINQNAHHKTSLSNAGGRGKESFLFIFATLSDCMILWAV
jgi:hypothetical protein